MITFGAEGSRDDGYLISQPPSVEISEKLVNKEEHISVFLPCAPNPTTGFFF